MSLLFTNHLELRHLGWSGLGLRIGGAWLTIDPPAPTAEPTVVTWTEQERVAGAREGRGPLLADARVLVWLGRSGTTLHEGQPVEVQGFRVEARPYVPIPYATPREALRKTLSACRSPRQAFRRVRFTLGRPSAPPLALRVEREGVRVVLLGQALHRFLPAAELDGLVEWAGAHELLVAGTDFDDEAATGRQLGRFDAQTRVVADTVGQVRRLLHLPPPDLAAAIAAAPPGTHRLDPR